MRRSDSEDACITKGSGWKIKGDNGKKKKRYIASEDACITKGSGWKIKGAKKKKNNKK